LTGLASLKKQTAMPSLTENVSPDPKWSIRSSVLGACGKRTLSVDSEEQATDELLIKKKLES